VNQERILNYLSETLHQAVAIKPWGDETNLPLYYRAYEFRVLIIKESEILLIAPKEGEAPTPTALEKHIRNLAKYWPGPVCVCQDSILPHTRKRLIEKQVQFIVPGTQLYLPCLGLDLRDYYAAPKQQREYFGPSAQALLVYILEHKLTKVLSSDVIKALGCSLMTATRALGELQAAGLCEKIGSRKNAAYMFAGTQLWETAEPSLRDPVQRRIWINQLPEGFPVFMSGLEALSEYTMIAASHRTVAVSAAVAKEIFALPGVEQLPYQEPDAVELEVWRYDPAITARGNIVDPRSLALCFKDDTDDRTIMEIRRMKEQW